MPLGINFPLQIGYNVKRLYVFVSEDAERTFKSVLLDSGKHLTVSVCQEVSNKVV